MGKLKLMTIVGTRPELIKLSEIIKKADQYFEHVFVHTGQNYDTQLNDIFYDDLGIRKPDYYLDVVGNNLGETIGNVIAKSYDLLVKIKPDAILILGDTNSALSAISAKRLKIPIFHLEAGNRCFDENLPEEINRKIVDHISDINLAYSENARRYLMDEGIKREYTFVVGSPMKEVYSNHEKEIRNSDVLSKLKLKKDNYFLLSAHREENVDNVNNFSALISAINNLSRQYKIPVIYSMHPRSKKIIEQRGIQFDENVIKMQPFSFTDYNALQENALCVISDSGTLAEESSLRNFNAVSIRTSSERPEALDRGNFIISGISGDSVLQAVDLAISMGKNDDIGDLVYDYEHEHMSSTVIKLIQSYTTLVNKNIWRKE